MELGAPDVQGFAVDTHGATVKARLTPEADRYHPPLGTGFGGYEMVTGCCTPGRTLLLYTDGLVEHREQDVDEWLGRLTRQRLPSDGSLEDQLAVLLAGLVPGGTAEDDVAVMAARLAP
ncbi:SpoIIE family protein phosphatase [Streptomyces phaeochromogenes]